MDTEISSQSLSRLLHPPHLPTTTTAVQLSGCNSQVYLILLIYFQHVFKILFNILTNVFAFMSSMPLNCALDLTTTTNRLSRQTAFSNATQKRNHLHVSVSSTRDFCLLHPKRPHSLSICVLVGWLVGAASCVSPPRNKSVYVNRSFATGD